MRPVTNEEVIRCAKSKCKSCSGTGKIRVWAFIDPDTQRRTEHVCRCAAKAFTKKHGDSVQRSDSGLEWKEAAA